MSYAVPATSHATSLKSLNAIIRATDSDVGREVISKLGHGDFAGVIGIKPPNPDEFALADDFANAYLAYNLIRKADFLPTGIDTAKVALDSFLDTESHCAYINRNAGRNPFVFDSLSGNLEQSFEATIWYARDLIKKALGRFSWSDVHSCSSFSGGASIGHTRRTGHPYYKFGDIPSVTRNAALLGVCAIFDSPLWKSKMEDASGSNDPCQWVEVVEGSRYTTVPKTSGTDRSICIEPTLNMFFQKGVGKLIRRALRRCGIDLNDQSWNQHLAWIGSRTGSLATVDLAAASDSIALSVVEMLLPREWFDALMLLRSSHVQLPCGSWHELEKISSMGNGFTFELESLIFWALTKAVVNLSGVSDNRLGIYGDDIVCHHSVAPRLLEVLEYVGFTANNQKTFISGPFRESCGKHYFYGQDVTPISCKTDLVSDVQRMYWLINSYNEWLARRDVVTKAQAITIRYLVKAIPKRDRFYVPPHLGLNAGLWCGNVAHSGCTYSLRKQGYIYRVRRSRRRRHTPNGSAAVLAWFGSPSSSGSTTDAAMEIQVGEVKYYTTRGCTSVWCDSDIAFGDVLSLY